MTGCWEWGAGAGSVDGGCKEPHLLCYTGWGWGRGLGQERLLQKAAPEFIAEADVGAGDERAQARANPASREKLPEAPAEISWEF